MSKPRNKTNRRRLHYMGVLAAAGLLTMGASPLLAQTTVAPGDDITSISGDVHVTGNASAGTTTIGWKGEVTGDVKFGSIYNGNASSPSTVTVTVSTNSSAGTLTNIGSANVGNGGVTVNVSGANLEVGAITSDTGSGLTFNVSGGHTLTQTGTVLGNVAFNAVAGAGDVSLGTVGSGVTISNLSDINTYTVAEVNNTLSFLIAENTGAGKMVIKKVSRGSNTYGNAGGEYEVGVAGTTALTNNVVSANNFTNDGGTYEIKGDIEATGSNNFSNSGTGGTYTISGEIKDGAGAVYTNGANAGAYAVGTISGGIDHKFTNNSADGIMSLGKVTGNSTTATLDGTGGAATYATEVTAGAELTLKNGADAKSVHHSNSDRGVVIDDTSGDEVNLTGGGVATVADGSLAAKIKNINNATDTDPDNPTMNIVKGATGNAVGVNHVVEIENIAGLVTIGGNASATTNEQVQSKIGLLSDKADVVLSKGSTIDQVTNIGQIGSGNSTDIITVKNANDGNTDVMVKLGTLKNKATLIYENTSAVADAKEATLKLASSYTTIENKTNGAADVSLAVQDTEADANIARQNFRRVRHWQYR